MSLAKQYLNALIIRPHPRLSGERAGQLSGLLPAVCQPLHLCYLVEGGDSGCSLRINTKWNLAATRALALRAPFIFRLINAQNGALRTSPPPFPAHLYLIAPARLVTHCIYRKIPVWDKNPGTNKAALDRVRDSESTHLLLF